MLCDLRRLVGGVLHAINRAGASRQVVEASIGAYEQINRRRDVGGKPGHRPVAGVESANPAGAVIGEEVDASVLAGELDGHRIVERATSDGAALRVRISVERIAEAGRTAITFATGPSIIRSGHAVIDLLPGTFADVVDEHAARAWLEGEGEGVAQAQSPDRAIDAGRLVVERIV